MEKFSYEANGYNRNEVNQFIIDVIKETEGIMTKVKSQNNEISSLKRELEHYKMRLLKQKKQVTILNVLRVKKVK